MRVRWRRRCRWCGYRKCMLVLVLPLSVSDVRRLSRGTGTTCTSTSSGHMGYIVTKMGLRSLHRHFDRVEGHCGIV